MKFTEIDPLLCHGAKKVTLCKWCKFNGRKPNAPFCEKYPLEGVEMKPVSVTYKYGKKGECPHYEISE